jgi:hypothetical protein
MGMLRGVVTPYGGMGRRQLGNAQDMGVSEGSRTVDKERVEVDSKHGEGGSKGKVDNRQMLVAEGSGHDRMSNLSHEGLIKQLLAETRLLIVPCFSALLLSIFC